MHEEEWNGKEYDLYSPRIESRGPDALPSPELKDENSLGNALKQEVGIAREYTGIFGFGAGSFWDALFPDTNEMGKEVYYQVSPSCPTQKLLARTQEIRLDLLIGFISKNTSFRVENSLVS